MGDVTYDAVIIGGGNKGLTVAMYLAKYGGMDVAILEKRLEAANRTTAPLASRIMAGIARAKEWVKALTHHPQLRLSRTQPERRAGR